MPKFQPVYRTELCLDSFRRRVRAMKLRPPSVTLYHKRRPNQKYGVCDQRIDLLIVHPVAPALLLMQLLLVTRQSSSPRVGERKHVSIRSFLLVVDGTFASVYGSFS